VKVAFAMMLVCASASARAAPVAPPPAAAAPSTAASVSAAKLAEARLHFQQGVALYKDQNFDAALAEFQGAYAISGEPVVLYDLGLTQKALFRYGEAIETLEKYLSDSAARGQTIAKARRAEVETSVSEMKSLLADVTLVVKPPEAAVLVDGRAVTLDVEGIVKLAAGSHVVEASAPDHVADKRTLTVVAGTPQTVTLALAAVPRTGRARVQAAQVGARVAIDGKDVGPAPVETELLAGGHTVEVTAPGFAPDRIELVVAVGQARTVTVTLEPPRAPAPTWPAVFHRWWFWAAVGGVAAATTATILLWPTKTEGPLSGSLGTARSDFQ
jgi:hypothetical protein